MALSKGDGRRVKFLDPKDFPGAKRIRNPCGTCGKIRAHMPEAIRKRLEAVEDRMKNGKR